MMDLLHFLLLPALKLFMDVAVDSFYLRYITDLLLDADGFPTACTFLC